MKKILYITLAAAAVLTACNKYEHRTSAGTGKLSVSLLSEGEYVTKADNSDVSAFVIDITRADGYALHYDRFDAVPEVLELGSGDYTITASSPETADAAFDLPVYGASAQVTIRPGELTPVTLSCGLVNMKVSFILSENFQKELSSYSVTVTNASSWTADDADGHTLVWSKEDVDSGKAGYFSVAPLMVKVDGYRSIDNSEAHAQLTITDVAARDHHIITLDAQVTGSVKGISITVDETVVEKNTEVYIPGWEETPVEGGGSGGDDPDDPETPVSETAPTMTWEANPTFAPTAIEETMDVNIVIDAPETIAGFIVTVDSGILSDVIAALAGDTSYSYAADGPYDMDLINNAALVEALAGMGVPTGDQLEGQTEVLFSLSTLVPLIRVYNPESGSNHIFILKVTDAKGQTLEKSLTFVMP